jgi:hypothetical protein
VIDQGGNWREHGHGRARELVAPSEEWLQSVANDPDAAKIYADAQTRALLADEETQRLAVIDIQREAIPVEELAAKVAELKQGKPAADGAADETPAKGK